MERETSYLKILAGMGLSLVADELDHKPKDEEEEHSVIKQRLVPEDDGYLGENLKYVRLILLHGKDDPIRVIKVDGKKNVGLMKNYLPEKDPDVEVRLHVNFRLRDAYGDDHKARFVQQAPGGDFAVTQFSENNFRIVRFGEDGLIRMYEVGVASQFGRQFLEVKAMAKARAGYVRQDNRQVIRFNVMFGPDWNEWPQFISFIQQMADEGLVEPSHNFELEPAGLDTPLEPADITKGMALVKWFDILSGAGCLKVAPNETLDGESLKGDVKVHWTQVVTKIEGQRVELFEGQLVSYQSLEPIKQDESTKHPTAFMAPALAVVPLD